MSSPESCVFVRLLLDRFGLFAHFLLQGAKLPGKRVNQLQMRGKTWRRRLTVEMSTKPPPNIHDQLRIPYDPQSGCSFTYSCCFQTFLQLPEPVCHKLSGIRWWPLPSSTYRWTQGAAQIAAQCKLAFMHDSGCCVKNWESDVSFFYHFIPLVTPWQVQAAKLLCFIQIICRIGRHFFSLYFHRPPAELLLKIA